MSRPSSHPDLTETEALVRRMYADVGDRTIVAERAVGGAVVVPLDRRAPSRRLPRALMAAAAAVLVVASGALLVRRNDTAPGTPPDESSLVHVVPGALPSFDGSFDGAFDGAPTLASDTTFLPLQSIASDEERDVLRYATDDVELTITVLRGAVRGLVVEPNTTLGDGTPAMFSTDGGLSLTWDRQAGMQVSVLLNGGDEPLLRGIANGLVYVADDAWAAATEHAGFAPTRSSTTPGIIARYELATEVPLTVGVRGRLHDGFRFWIGEGMSFSWGADPASTEQCFALPLPILTGDPSDGATIAVLSRRQRRVEVTVRGQPSFSVDVTERVPGSSSYVQAVAHDTGGEAALSWACEEVLP